MQSTAGSKEIAATRTFSASGIPLVTVLGLYLMVPVRVELDHSCWPGRRQNIGDSALETHPTTPVGALATRKIISEAILIWRSAYAPKWESHGRCSLGWTDCGRNSSRSEVRGARQTPPEGSLPRKFL